LGSPVVSIEKAEIDIVRRNGEVIVAEMRVARSDLDGETLYIASLRDITELARLRDELQTASFVDELNRSVQPTRLSDAHTAAAEAGGADGNRRLASVCRHG
jgi:hypothetical protein